MSTPETTRPTTRDLIRYALVDAIQWQESLAAAHHPGTQERYAARARAMAYRVIMKRRYGSERTPMEHAMDGAQTVTLDELRGRCEADAR